MDSSEVYDQLTVLTDGLLYISEAESEFSVYEVEDPSEIDSMMEDVAGQSITTFNEENYTLFFDRVVAALDVADAAMQEIRQKYIALFEYLQTTFKDIRVLTAGDVEQNIFVLCTAGKGSSFLLHTIAVES